MAKIRPAKKKPSAKAKSAHKPVKKAIARPTKNKARKHTVEKKHSKPSHPPKSAKPAKGAHAAKAAPEAKTPPPAKGKRDAASSEAASARPTPDELRKQLVAKAKSRAKTQRAAAFTLDDVHSELARSTVTRGDSSRKGGEAAPKSGAAAGGHGTKKVVAEKGEQRRLGAASLADILGYNPVKNERPTDDESQIDPKFVRYYKLLVQLREHVTSGLTMHAEDTLKRSNREDSGDLSGYGQHMADAGTDNFDRDFALSLVSNEQEALYEIEEAIKRIKNGTYGICEVTGKPISKERLLAVPFARYSVESQAEIEKVRRRNAQRGGVFSEAGTEEGAKLVEEDSE